MLQEDFNQEFQRVKALRKAEVDRLADAGARIAEINAERTRLGASIRPEELAGSGPFASDPDHEAVLEVQVRSSLQPADHPGLGARLLVGSLCLFALHRQPRFLLAPLISKCKAFRALPLLPLAVASTAACSRKSNEHYLHEGQCRPWGLHRARHEGTYWPDDLAGIGHNLSDKDLEAVLDMRSQCQHSFVQSQALRPAGSCIPCR